MRRLFTTQQFLAAGKTKEALAQQTRDGLIRRIRQGVYGDGGEEPSAFDLALAHMLASQGPVWGTVAARILGFDAMKYFPHRVQPRRQTELLDPTVVTVNGYECTSALQTIVDIAYLVDDLVWEQALESGLHRKLFTLPQIEALLPRIRGSRRHGSPRIRRVLDLRPPGAPPTESLLETLMVQLARTIPGLPPPTRQLRIVNEHGTFVARVDLCWPEFGVFIELDGEHHKDQPVYDANRQNRVTGATGWLCGRFTWTQVHRFPQATARELAALLEQGRRRLAAVA